MDVVGAINVRTSINTAVDAGARAKQNSEFNQQLEQNTVNQSPLQNIRNETRIDPAAPVQNTPLNGFAQEDLLSPSPRGNNLDIFA